MKFELKVWRQTGPAKPGGFVHYTVDDVQPDMSFLEMLDQLNEELAANDEDPIAFDSDCREGICGTCGLMIDGRAHGPQVAGTTCELRMREFQDGSTITVEPFRANGFPIIKDLVVDRSAFDRMVAAGGYISVNTGSAPEANTIPIHKETAEAAMDASICIGCGACVAACPNASASLFVGAKLTHLSLLPQGQVEREERAVRMVEKMDEEAFGNCTNYAECQAACPKDISIATIAQMRREYLRGITRSR